MQRKCCDLMVSNSPTAIDSDDNEVEILTPDSLTLAQVSGTKLQVAQAIIKAIHTRLLPG
jgi:phosphopantothenoylcysteine decarboxylase/phosphopantothenate--cysteine ligase